MILDATDTTFRVYGLVQAVERVRAEADGTAAEARDRADTTDQPVPRRLQ
jgi:hypothetical protein